MTKEDKQKGTALHLNTGLPNLFVDDIRIAVRNDDLVTINFFSDSPEGKFEQTRVVMQKQRLKAFLDSMCKHVGYYPVAPVEEKEEEKKKKK